MISFYSHFLSMTVLKLFQNWEYVIYQYTNTITMHIENVCTRKDILHGIEFLRPERKERKNRVLHVIRQLVNGPGYPLDTRMGLFVLFHLKFPGHSAIQSVKPIQQASVPALHRLVNNL